MVPSTPGGNATMNGRVGEKFVQGFLRSYANLHFKNAEGWKKYLKMREHLKSSDHVVCGHVPRVGLWGRCYAEWMLDTFLKPGVFLCDPNGRTRILFECKSQRTSGSVLEKLPYILRSWQISDIPNWILVCSGPFWQSHTAREALCWLSEEASCYENRVLRIFNTEESFGDFAREYICKGE